MAKRIITYSEFKASPRLRAPYAVFPLDIIGAPTRELINPGKNNLTFQSGQKQAISRMGYGENFSGTGNATTVPIGLALGSLDTCSFFCWIRTTAAGRVEIYGDADNALTQFLILSVSNGTTGALCWRMRNDANNITSIFASTATNMNDGAAHFVGFAASGRTTTSMSLNLYIDGRKDSTHSPTVTIGGASTPTGARLGAVFGNGTDANLFAGDMKNAMFFRHFVTPAEAKILYEDQNIFRSIKRRRNMAQAPSNNITITPPAGSVVLGGQAPSSGRSDAITVEATANSGYQAAQSTYTFNRTVTGVNKFLAVDVAILSAGQTVTGVIDDSGGANVPMRFMGARSTVTSFGRVESWGLIAPTDGVKSIQVNLSGIVVSVGMAVAYGSIHQGTPTEGFNTAQATDIGDGVAEVSITSIADADWLHSAIATDDTSVIANSGPRNNVSGAGGSGADQSDGPYAAGVHPTQAGFYDINLGATWALVGYALRPANAAAVNTFTPASGAVLLTGQAPTVTLSNNGLSITPAQGALVLNGQAPSIATTGNWIIAPSAGALLLTGQAPSLTQTARVSFTPDTGALLFNGQAPAISIQGAAICQPDTGSIIITGCIPQALVSGETFGRSGLGGDDIPRRRSPHRGWDRKEYERRKAQEDELQETIKETYQQLIGTAPAPVVEQVQKIVKAKVKPSAQGPVLKIDWAAIARSYERTNALIKLQQEEAELAALADDEETVLMLAVEELSYWRKRADL